MKLNKKEKLERERLSHHPKWNNYFQLEDKYNDEKEFLIHSWAKENTDFELGDIIQTHVGKYEVTKISNQYFLLGNNDEYYYEIFGKLLEITDKYFSYLEINKIDKILPPNVIKKNGEKYKLKRGV